jgi:hypothetical protein
MEGKTPRSWATSLCNNDGGSSMRSAMLTTCLANVSYYHHITPLLTPIAIMTVSSQVISRFRHRTRLLRFRSPTTNSSNFQPSHVMPHSVPNYIHTSRSRDLVTLANKPSPSPDLQTPRDREVVAHPRKCVMRTSIARGHILGEPCGTSRSKPIPNPHTNRKSPIGTTFFTGLASFIGHGNLTQAGSILFGSCSVVFNDT